MTLTTPGCPVAGSLPGQVEQAVQGVQGITAVQVELVWEPAWTRDRISETAQLELGIL
jgi:metal-sulfur cluster biosynthetic enzyme